VSNFNTYYFFAELSFDLAIWHGLVNIIRDQKPGARFELICSLDKRIESYDISPLIEVYDRVHRIRGASFYSYGSWRKGLTARNIYSALFRTFPDARRTYKDLQEIGFALNSVAFVHGAHNLTQWLFLKRIKSAPKVKSVFFLSTDSPHDNNLFKSDWFINRGQSAYLNIHAHFFGTAYLDVHWIKTPDSIVTNHRHFVLRDKPADFVFWPVFPLRFKTLQSDQIYLPLPFVNKPSNQSQYDTVLFVGGKYHFLQGLPRESETIFLKRLNTIIKLIKKKHPGQRLLYKSHPSQNQADLKKLDLAGFEIESYASSEAIFINDSSLRTVYSVFSTSVQAAASMGIPSFYLYNLFDLDELFLPETVQRHWNDRCISEVHPQMNIRSIEDWMDGKNDYVPQDAKEKIYNSTVRMLEEVGALESVPERN
jgi:hypothetical protein